MKKTIKVVVEREYEIDIKDELLTQEFVDQFEEGFWQLDGSTLNCKIEGLFKAAAQQLANGEEQFIEGVGRCASVRTVEYKEKAGQRIDVVWDDTYEDMEVEVVG